jgi:DNA-binding transcriptional LysR family regulator
VPLKTQLRLTTELGVYVRAGRTLPPAVDAFIRILAEEIERREAEEPA